jgi:predicted FMN-binding regulatory protein PaiB
MSRAIVAFTIELDEVTAKLKLSQNRSPADHTSVVDHLTASDDAGARDVASWMRRTGRR